MSRRRTGRNIRVVVALAIVGLLAGIVVSTAAALRFTDDSCTEASAGGIRVCPEGVVGTSYTKQLRGVAGCEPYHAYRVINGSLPPGLSLSSSGLISGTPTQAGNSSFWVELRDLGPAEGGPAWCTVVKTTEREFTINVLPGLRITTNSLPQPASVGAPYSAALETMLVTSLSPLAGSRPGALSWSIIPGSGSLPPGLTLANGVISGTPTTEGSYQFQVQAELDPTRRHSQTLTIVVRQPLVITAAAPFSGGARIVRTEVGVPMSTTLKAAGGSGTYTWALASGALPRGLTTSNGTIVGKPTTPGSYLFTLSLTDSEGRTALFAATVLVAPKLAITTLFLRPAKVGKHYRAKLATSGGVAPTKWAARGPLPRGVRFDRALGVLSGTPTKAGRYRVVFEAVDALKVTSTRTLVIDVLA